MYLRTGHYLSPEGGGVGRFWLCHQKHTWSPVKSCDIFMIPLNWQSVFYGFFPPPLRSPENHVIPTLPPTGNKYRLVPWNQSKWADGALHRKYFGKRRWVSSAKQGTSTKAPLRPKSAHIIMENCTKELQIICVHKLLCFKANPYITSTVNPPPDRHEQNN